MRLAEQAAELLRGTGEYALVDVVTSRTLRVVGRFHTSTVRVYRDNGVYHKPTPCVYVSHDGMALRRYGV